MRVCVQLYILLKFRVVFIPTLYYIMELKQINSILYYFLCACVGACCSCEVSAVNRICCFFVVGCCCSLLVVVVVVCCCWLLFVFVVVVVVVVSCYSG